MLSVPYRAAVFVRKEPFCHAEERFLRRSISRAELETLRKTGSG